MQKNELAILLILVSTSCMNVGVVIQKRGMDSLPPVETQTLGRNILAVMQNRLWLTGMALVLVAMGLNFWALSMAELSLVQPLTAFGLVVLVIFSRMYLKEKVTMREGIGIAMVIMGVVLLGLSSRPQRHFESFGEITGFFLKGEAVSVLGLFMIAVAALWIHVVRKRYHDVGVPFALIAALFSATGFTFAKGFSSALALDGFGTTGAVSDWRAWLLLMLFILCSTMALVAQQVSFQKGKAIRVNPVFNAGSIVLPVMTGVAVFDEWALRTMHEIIFQVIAMAIIIAGVIILSGRQEPLPVPRRRKGKPE